MSAGWNDSIATSSATTRRTSPSSPGRCATAPGSLGSTRTSGRYATTRTRTCRTSCGSARLGARARQLHLRAAQRIRVFCYDDDTEVLTTEGWKPWPKVDGTEVFGTLNPVSNELEYQKATEVFHADYAGPMYRVRSEQVDLLVTPNHRMWIQRHDTQAAKRGEQAFAIETARDILHKRVKYQKNARWTGCSPDNIWIPETCRTYQRSDRDKPATRAYPGIVISRRALCEVPRLLPCGGLLSTVIRSSWRRIAARFSTRWPIRFAQWGCQHTCRPLGIGCVRTQCVPLRDFLAGLGHAYDKRIPAMVGEWPPDTIRIFLEAMIEGDGTTHHTFNHRVIYTASRDMADESADPCHQSRLVCKHSYR